MPWVIRIDSEGTRFRVGETDGAWFAEAESFWWAWAFGSTEEEALRKARARLLQSLEV